MKLISFFLLVLGLAASAAADSQPVTLSEKNASLKKVFNLLSKQTGLSVFYDEADIKKANPVTIDVKDMPLDQVLILLFRDQPFNYTVGENSIVVKVKSNEGIAERKEFSAPPPPITVKGHITNEAGEPVQASIIVKGTQNGASSNADGYYELKNVDEKATLVITGVGIEPQEIRVNSRVTINVVAKIAVKEGDEIVVAYNKTTVQKNVSAITLVKGEQIQTLPARSIDRALQGLVPGLQIVSGSGVPGGGVNSVLLRGISTGGIGIVRQPLFVIDGTIITQRNFNYTNSTTDPIPPNAVQPTNPMAQLNPYDIETITVLKDAAAIALYGSQASNGVILITTKKGKPGKIKIDFKHQTDFAAREKEDRKILNQKQYLDLLYESYRNANPVQWTDQAIFNDLKNKFPYQVKNGDTSFYSAPNWFDELYNNHAAAISNDVSISGGNDIVTNYVGLGQLNQKGILKNTDFNRYSLRYNLNFKPVKWFQLGLNSSISYTHQDHAGSGDLIQNPNGFSYVVSPLLPVRKDNGQFQFLYPNGAGASNVQNPVAAMEFNANVSDAYRSVGNLFAEVNFLRHFSFKTNIGADILSAETKTKTDKRLTTNGIGVLQKLDETRSILLVNNILRYNKNFGSIHSINALLGHEAQIVKSNVVSASGQGFPAGFSEDDLSSATTKSVTGLLTESTFLSYFGQFNYDFKRKYLASAGIRLDGSSRFGDSTPLRKFWSFGGGWVLTEEKFLRSAKGWLDYLKIRGSIGIAGNSIAIPSYTKADRVTGVIYSNSPATYPSSVQLTPGNPYVEPERTFNTDLGLEGNFWNQRINLTFDIYKRKTFDLVTSFPQPLTTGRASVYGNLGDIENKGIEISLSIDIIRTSKMTWNINANWSSNTNKLTKAYDTLTTYIQYANKVGESYNSWYLVRWGGVDPQTGSALWLDKTGKPTATYPSDGAVVVGKSQPGGFGGLASTLTYGHMKMSVLFYYTYGYKVYNEYLLAMMNDGSSQPYSNQSILALDRWQKPGDITLNPKRILNNPQFTMNASTRYLVDGDYIRLKNLLVSYLFDKKMLDRLHIKNLEVFVQGNNLAIWTKGKDIDPDNVGSASTSGIAYPQQRTFSVGLNLGL